MEIPMPRRPRFLAFIALLLCFTAGHAVAQVPADLQKAMQDRDNAVNKIDAAAWDRLTSDGFTLVDETGTFFTKAERLAQLKTQKPTAATPLERVQIKRVGDIYVRRFLSGGQWWLDIWVHEPSGWRVAAVQGTTAKK